MTRATKITLLVVCVALVCWVVARQTQIFDASGRRIAQEDLKWQARAEATADDPKAARQVIIDSIYAGKTFVVAQAYEAAFQEKPTRETRIANFAHAADVTDNFSFYESKKNRHIYEDNAIFRLIDHARTAVKSIIQPPDDASLHTDIELEDARSFKPTRIADAWLAWANFSGDSYLSYQHAIKLDPNFGEAYLEMVQEGALYRTKLPIKTKYALAAWDLDRAEQLEPKLHPLVSSQRYLLALKQGNKKAAIAYLREALRTWPTAPNAEAIRQQLAQMEAAERKHDARAS